MNRKWLIILVAISAVLIAGSAAFFSVTGLSILFSGAATSVMIMAISLEFAKLVCATYLKQEWDSIKGINKWYLTSAVVILMVITSAGIFGYLSNAFQQQNLKLEQVQREIQVWQNKIEYTNQQITTLQTQQKDLSETQNTLIQKGNVNTRLLKSVDNRDKQSSVINKKINSLQDSIVTYNSHINDVKNNNINIEREVGGFRFVAEAFNVSLNSVVKFFIILIVIVFDPLAVALIIAFNGLLLKKEEESPFQKELKDFVEGYDPVTYGAKETKNEEVVSNKIDAADLVGEISRVRLSENDLQKLEEILLNPPPPNEALKEAAEDYKEKVVQKPWSNLPDEVWERMQILEAERESKYGPMDPEDEPTALANSGITEREEILSEIMQADEELGLYDEPLIVEKSAPVEESLHSKLEKIRESLEDRELFFEPTISDNFTIGPDGAYEREDEEELIEEQIIPVDEAVDNEPEIQQDFTNNEIVEDISQNVKQDEHQTEVIPTEEITQSLTELETQTFSQEPTSLEDEEEKKN